MNLLIAAGESFDIQKEKKKERKDTDVVLKVNALEQNTHFPSLSGAKLLLCGGYFSAFCRGKAETAQLCCGRNHCCLQKDGLLKGLQTSWTKKNVLPSS